jgi:hypothetical protein
MTLPDLPTMLSYLTLLVAAATNAYAFAIAVGVRRTAQSATLRRLARRCGLSVLVILGLSALLFVVGLLDGFAATNTDPSQRATRIANAISEAMNCTVLAVMGSALPSAVGLWLRWRACRAP